MRYWWDPPAHAVAMAYFPAWPPTATVSQSVCRVEAFSGDFTCRQCGTEGDFYRRRICARCALRGNRNRFDLSTARAALEVMAEIVEALCGVDWPASIVTWKRSPRVQESRHRIGPGVIPPTHQGLDAAGTDKAINHLRSLLSNTPVSWLPAMNRWLGLNVGFPRNSRR